MLSVRVCIYHFPVSNLLVNPTPKLLVLGIQNRGRFEDRE